MKLRLNWRRASLLFTSWAFIVLWLLPTFGHQFSPDSYGNLLLGRNLFHGLGFTSPAARDLFVPPEYPVVSRSFPPLYPILVGIVDRFSSFAIASGVLVNMAVLAGVVWVLATTFKRFESTLGFAPFFASLLVLALTPSLTNDVAGARALPLTFLLVLYATYVAVERDTPVLLGVTLGLAALARFDTTAFAIFLPILLALMGKHTLRNSAKTYFAMMLVYATWGVRNWLLFGSFFASDNAISALSLTPGMAQLEWYIETPPRAWNAVHEWSTQRVSYLVENVHVLVNGTQLFGGLVPLLALAALPFASGLAREKTRWYGAVVLLFVVANLASVSLTSFHDARYFAISAALTFIALAQWACEVISERCTPHIFIGKWTRLGEAALLTACASCLILVWFFRTSYVADQYEERANLQQLRELIAPIIPPGSRVATGVGYAESMSYYMGYLTVSTPNGPFFTPAFYDWQRHWRVDFAIVPPTYTMTSEWNDAVRASLNGWRVVDLHVAPQTK